MGRPAMGEEPHVVLLPLMAQGHVIPFFELAKLLAKRASFIITIVNSPSNVRRLEPVVASACKEESLDIRLEELPFPKGIQGVPAGVENTDSLPYNLMFKLVQACERLEKPFEQLLQRLSDKHGRRPTCIISDLFFGWTLDVANRLGIPRVTFNTIGAFATCVYYSLWMYLPHRQTDADTFALPDLPDVSFHKSQIPLSLKLTDDRDPWHLFLKRQIPKNLQSWGTLVNTFAALERKFVDQMRETHTCGRVWSIGPVLPNAVVAQPPKKSNTPSDMICSAPRGKASGISQSECLEWLQSHPPSSVLYISFGTQVTISTAQMEALALGLEASGQPFIWAVRPPVEISQHSINKAFNSSDFLPDGFEKRMKETKQGLLLKGWAPQLFILSHSSTGGFLSHCGWNSILESLSTGVPILGWPIAAEQFYNSKLLEEEVGVSVEVCRGVDGELSQERVESVVKMLMMEDKGIELRKKAREMREAAKGAVSAWMSSSEDKEIKGTSVSNLDEFIREMTLLSPKEANEDHNCGMPSYCNFMDFDMVRNFGRGFILLATCPL
eukprot:Gb_34096 [translate_table: standard]